MFGKRDGANKSMCVSHLVTNCGCRGKLRWKGSELTIRKKLMSISNFVVVVMLTGVSDASCTSQLLSVVHGICICIAQIQARPSSLLQCS